MQATRKPSLIEAKRYYGTHASAVFIVKWVIANGGYAEQLTTVKAMLHVRDSYGVSTAIYRGQWVVLEYGRLRTYNENEFFEAFDLVPTTPKKKAVAKEAPCPQ